MEKDYKHFSAEEIDILELSPILEHAPYLLQEAQELTYMTRGNSKSGTCQCASSRSSGGTCRALSLDSRVISK
jgi:hypothetical protein